MAVKVSTTLDQPSYDALAAKCTSLGISIAEGLRRASVAWAPPGAPPPPPPPPAFAVTIESATVSGSTATVTVVGTGGVVNIVLLEGTTKLTEGAPDVNGRAVLVASGLSVGQHTLSAQGWDSAPGQPGNATAVVSTTVTVASAPPPPPSGYTNRDVGFSEGSSIGNGLTQRLDGMRAYVGGAPIVRVDLDWWYVEDSRGSALRWDRLDSVVNGAIARNMRVLVTLDYAPPWANGGHADDKWFPTSDADWTSIIDRTVAHCGANVVAYEVWNEPNGGFASYATDRKVRYWQLVRLAYQRIKAARPTTPVLAGASAAAGGPDEPAVWLDWAYANGYGANFDAVCHHPYPAWNSGLGPAQPECTTRNWNMFGPPGENPPCGELAYVHQVMVARGDGAKKIWGTEWGYPTSGGGTTDPNLIRDYAVQGVQMWRALSYTGPLFLYSYRDAGTNATDPEMNFGVVTASFAHKEPLFTDLKAALV